MIQLGRLLVALSLLSVAAVGCSAGFGAKAYIEDPKYDNDASAEGGAILGPDAGLGDATRFRGNPLCNVQLDSDPPDCLPDDEIACSSVKDGGADSGAYATKACRVDVSNDPPSPACKTVPMQPKAEGDSCTSASDCAAGYECVGSPSRCRHYCCESTSCTTLSKLNANKPYFCDIQPLAAQSSQTVPVCQPVMPCSLQTQDCGTGQTCAIVESSGMLTTSCVAVGPGKVGDACDAQHCGLNLQCIGAPMPTCHQLCDPKMPTCPTGTMCFHQWPVLDQQGVGVCKAP